MCIFSGGEANPVRHVGGTRIFARPEGEDRQLLVYSMQVALDSDAAMILPLPIAAGSGDDAVEFIDLSTSSDFFDRLADAFDATVTLSLEISGAPGLAQPQPLIVHDVGDFEASFVPSTADFDRLDPRFRLAPEVWAALPDVSDWGFAVFKLKAFAARPPPIPAIEPRRRSWLSRLFSRESAPAPTASPSPQGAPVQARTIHRMALSFPTRRPGALFFPTVHVHDGQVHEQAQFDHSLYCQRSRLPRSEAREIAAAGLGAPTEFRPPVAMPGWQTSDVPLAIIVAQQLADGVVDLSGYVHRFAMTGTRPNRDIWVDL